MADNQPEEAVNNSKKLTDAQKARIERNRQKALLLKQSRLVKKPIEKEQDCSLAKIPKIIDTDGGFLIELTDTYRPSAANIIHEPAPYVGDALLCLECSKDFMESYLYNHFNHNVCDSCRDNDDKHKLITKTDAKSTYLLKEADFDKREPPLKFIVKKNPRKKFGDMKLYLELQVKARAMEVWGDEEKITEEQEKRTENKEVAKQKRFDKKVKELRKTVRSSLFKKDFGPHEHQYGDETHNDEDDTYSKTCITCGQVVTFEKM